MLLFAFKFLKIRLLAQGAQEKSRRGSRQPNVRDFLTVWGLALESSSVFVLVKHFFYLVIVCVFVDFLIFFDIASPAPSNITAEALAKGSRFVVP